MGREWEMESSFSEDLDRMLAGETVTISSDAGEDYRADLEFARELIRRRVDPSPSFADRLREKLLGSASGLSTRKRSSGVSFLERLGSIRYKPLWRPAMAVFLALVLAFSILWSTGLLPGTLNPSPEVIAASIANDSPQVRSALDEEKVEVTEVTQIVDQEGTVLMWSKTRAVVARVDLKTEQVTEVIPVEVPEFTAEDEREAIDLVKADPRAQALFAKGGFIVKVSPMRSIIIKEVPGPDGQFHKEGSVSMGASIVIQQGVEKWFALVSLEQKRVLNVLLARNTGFNHVIDVFRDTAVPIIAAAGLVVLIGLLYFKRLPAVLTGIFSLIFGILSIPTVMYAARFTPAWLAPVFLVPVLGLVTGYLGMRKGKKWVSIPGLVLCSLALAYQIFVTYMTLR